MLFELKEKICTILEEWMKETPPLSPKMLQFPDCWPLDDLAPSMAPGVTREWAMRLLVDRGWGEITFPERTRAALQRYCHPDQPAPPVSQPTRPKPSQSTAQAKQGGGNRTRSSGNTPSFTEVMPTTLVDWTRLYRGCGLRRTEEYHRVALIRMCTNPERKFSAAFEDPRSMDRGLASAEKF